MAAVVVLAAGTFTMGEPWLKSGSDTDAAPDALRTHVHPPENVGEIETARSPGETAPGNATEDRIDSAQVDIAALPDADPSEKIPPISTGQHASEETPDNPAPAATTPEIELEKSGERETEQVEDSADKGVSVAATDTTAGPEPEHITAVGELVEEVQARLAMLGYSPGPIDGALRSQTRDAIRAFQIDAGLQTTGEIDNALMARLRQTQRVEWKFSG